MDKLLVEAAKAATKTKSGRWRVILAVPGKGSSGTYSAEVLESSGPAAFPAGTKSYINHDDKRDPRDILGSYPDGAFWDAEYGSEGALAAELDVLPRWRDFVEEVAPLTGLSMFATGDIDEKTENVNELYYNRSNSVDLVGEPGLEGSGIKSQLTERAKTLLEQARTAASADEKREEETVTKEELTAALAEALKPVLAFVSEQKQAAEAARAAESAKADEEPTVEQAVEAYAKAVTAVDEAELFDTQRKSLLERAKKGEDIAAAIEEAKTIKKEAVDSIKESATARRFESTSADSTDYSLGLDW